MSAYKLTFGDRVLSYQGHEGYVAFSKPEFQRYEISLFKSYNGCGVSAGNFTMPLSAFDEIGLGLTWQNGRELHGRNWVFLTNHAVSAATGSIPIVNHMSNGSNYFTFENLFNYDNANLSFTVPNNHSTQYWGIYTPIGTTATLLAANNGSRHEIIGEIIGVKYQ